VGPAAAGVGPTGPYKVKDLRVVSGPSLFAAGCPGAGDDQAITGHELEAAITVNPADRRIIVATWKQDVGPALSSRSDLVASSRDGGKTWTRSTLPGLTTCTGGVAEIGSDPWVSAGRHGTVYFSGLAAKLTAGRPETTVMVSRSRDGGRTWPAAVTVAPPLVGYEQPAVTGSPIRPGHAYLAFANFLPDVLPRTNSLEFSGTTDGGATWSSPVLIDQPGQFALDFAPRILVLPGGALLAVFARADIGRGEGQMYAARSVDEGRTWLAPVRIGSKPIPPPFADDTGTPPPNPAMPSAAAAPDGSVYVAFEDSTSASSGAIGLARSRDGGRTWTSAPLPGVSAYAFQPSVAVDAHGTVRVTWYDLRNDRAGDAALTADVWFAQSGDRGASWRQTHVAGPTDLRTAPLPAHNYVGEYQGLAALPGRGFAAIFTLATPQARNGQTDIFFARIGPCRPVSR
jgi:hypothetical protein